MLTTALSSMAVTKSVFLCFMNPRHMLVADAFNAMRAESVFQKCGALQGFACDDLAFGEDLLEIIAAGNCPC